MLVRERKERRGVHAVELVRVGGRGGLPGPQGAAARSRAASRQVTTIVPVIDGWIVHTKSYVPGAGAVASPVPPGRSPTATSVPLTVKLWGLASLFATEMVDPEATEKQFGLNAKFLTVSVPVSLVAFSDVQSLPPPPPQAAPVSAARTATTASTTIARSGVVGSVRPRRPSFRDSMTPPSRPVSRTTPATARPRFTASLLSLQAPAPS